MELTEVDRQKLRRALAAKPHLSGNLLTLIGLDEVRAKFPNGWDRRRARILETALTILQRLTDPSYDIIVPRGDDGFVVLFTRLGDDEARLRAAMIKAEILKRLTGDDLFASLAVEVQSVALNSGAATSDSLGDLLSRIAPLPATGPPASGPAADGAAPRRSAAVPGGPMPGAPGDRDRAGKAYRASLSELGAEGVASMETLERRFDFSFDDLEFAFLPHLNVARGSFSVFACRAVRRGPIGAAFHGYGVLPREPEAGQIVDLDSLTLLRVRHALVDMAVRKRVAAVVAPVSFETMTNRGAAAGYLGLLHQVPSDLRNYLVVGLQRCPAGVPEGRLAEIVSPLKRLVRAVSIRSDSPRHPLGAIKGAGAHAVGFDLGAELGAELGRRPAAVRDIGPQVGPAHLHRGNRYRGSAAPVPCGRPGLHGRADAGGDGRSRAAGHRSAPGRLTGGALRAAGRTRSPGRRSSLRPRCARSPGSAGWRS